MINAIFFTKNAIFSELATPTVEFSGNFFNGTRRIQTTVENSLVLVKLLCISDSARCAVYKLTHLPADSSANRVCYSRSYVVFGVSA